MNKINLMEVGQIFSNYKCLCDFLDEPIKAGKSKRLQLENFRRFFDWERYGQKYIITAVHDKPFPKEDKRKYGNNRGHFKQYSTYDVEPSENFKCGVYKIQLGMKVFIGSTINGFRRCFMEHSMGKRTLYTKELLESGGVFQIIWSVDKGDNNTLIKEMRKQYTDMYLKLGYEIVNKNTSG